MNNCSGIPLVVQKSRLRTTMGRYFACFYRKKTRCIRKGGSSSASGSGDDQL